MSDYTTTKRALQALGFKIIARKGGKDIILSKDDTKIRIVDDPETGALTYAALLNGHPVSWHKASRRCSESGRYLGFNNHIEVTNEDDLSDSEYEVFKIMYPVAHKGQWFNDLNAEWN